MVLSLQGHSDTPAHPAHHEKPKEAHKQHHPHQKQRPARPAGHGGHSGHNQQRHPGARGKANRHHKSSPETERTLPIGSGVRVRIPFTAPLPMREDET